MNQRNSLLKINTSKDNHLIINIPLGLYSKETVLKACYKNLDAVHVKLVCNKKDFVLEINPTDNKIPTESLLDKICDDLIDFELRNIIAQQTKEIRTALVERAFSN